MFSIRIASPLTFLVLILNPYSLSLFFCFFFFFVLMQVLNGLLSRDNQKEGISIPIGIIPAGSDNSLVWTVLGVRDPISAAMAIVKVTLFIKIAIASV